MDCSGSLLIAVSLTFSSRELWVAKFYQKTTISLVAVTFEKPSCAVCEVTGCRNNFLNVRSILTVTAGDHMAELGTLLCIILGQACA